MKRYKLIIQGFIFLLIFNFNNNCNSQSLDTIAPHYMVTLPEAHIGNQEIDTKLLDSYERLPENFRQFYLDARFVFSETLNGDFTNSKIIEAAQKNDLPLMGGPMLGNLSEDGVIIWLRPSTAEPLVVKVTKSDGGDEKTFKKNSPEPGDVQRIQLDGLSCSTDYKYISLCKKPHGCKRWI